MNEEYRGMRIEGPLLEQLIRACQSNPWLKIGGVDFEPEGLCCEHDCHAGTMPQA